MEPSTRAPGYDLFKLIVALILLILFLLLNRRVPPQALPPNVTPFSNANQTMVPASLTRTSPTTTNRPVSTTTALPYATLRNVSTSTPPAQPSETATNIATPTPPPPAQPSETATNAATSTPPPPLSPSETPTPLSTSTLNPDTPNSSACDAASSRSRLQIGGKATILRRLNFRSSPGIQDNWLRTNIPGTRVEVVSGPACIPHSIGAYVWWQIKLPDGQIGWSVEASQHGTFYFMEPIE
jgi:cytoskeletal protein RodZ